MRPAGENGPLILCLDTSGSMGRKGELNSNGSCRGLVASGYDERFAMENGHRNSEFTSLPMEIVIFLWLCIEID